MQNDDPDDELELAVAEEPGQRGRGNTVQVEKQWLDFLHSLWREVKAGQHPAARGERVSLEAFGVMLAEKEGREEAWSKGTLSRFLHGKQVTDDLLRAFSEFFGIPYPILCARSVDEHRWFEVGQSLRDAAPTEFARVLAHAQGRLVLAHEKRKLDQELDTNPET